MKSAPRGGGDNGLFAEVFQGRVVIHPVVAQHAAVAVGGIFAEAGIGHDDHLRHRGLTNPRHTRHQTIFIPGIAAGGIGVMRNTKGHHRADPGVGDAFDLARQIFFRNAHHAGHGLYRFVIINFFFNKDRQHQVVQTQCCLFKQGAQRSGLTQAAGASD